MKENKNYDCEKDGHIFDKWFPTSRREKRRVCLVPKCGVVDKREVKPGV